jgi:hypothetical protein
MPAARLSGSVALLAALALPAAARAQVINFEDYPTASFDVIASGYHGFNWIDMYALNTTNDPFAPVAAVSAPNVAFNGFGTPSEIDVPTPGTLTLGSIDLTQWAPFGGSPAPSVTVTGFLGTTQLFRKLVPLGPSYATTVFNWSGIDRVTFEPAPQAGGGWFVADNIVLGIVGTTTTPEPGSVALLATGLVALGLAARRRT